MTIEECKTKTMFSDNAHKIAECFSEIDICDFTQSCGAQHPESFETQLKKAIPDKADDLIQFMKDPHFSSGCDADLHLKSDLGHALLLLANEKGLVAQAYACAERFHVSEMFEDALKLLQKNDFDSALSIFEAIASEFAVSPENFVLKYERERFMLYHENWLSEKSIIGVWQNFYDHFPISNYRCFLLTLLLPEHIDYFTRLIGQINNPLIVRILLSHLIEEYRQPPNIIKELFDHSPICSNDDEGWNGNLLAPVLLGVIYESEKNNRIENNFESKAEFKEYLFCEILQIAATRSDGLFLIFNFTDYMLRDLDISYCNSKQSRHIEIIESLIAKTAEHFSHEKALCLELNYGIPDNYESLYQKYLQTGEVVINDQTDSLLKLLRQQFIFIEEEPPAAVVEKLISKFEKCNIFCDNEFHTSYFEAALPQGKHYEIGALYAMHENSASRWHQTWRSFSSQIHRLNYTKYSSNESDENNINFCFVFGFAICDWHIDQGEFEKAKSLILKVWNEIITLHHCGDFVYERLIERLIPLTITRLAKIYGSLQGSFSLNCIKNELHSLTGDSVLIKVLETLVCNNIVIETNALERELKKYLASEIQRFIDKSQFDKPKMKNLDLYEKWLQKLTIDIENSSQ
jgi:hypothetical protein